MNIKVKMVGGIRDGDTVEMSQSDLIQRGNKFVFMIFDDREYRQEYALDTFSDFNIQTGLDFTAQPITTAEHVPD